ncbi:hypothetical protein Micbo1qcDRAFT_163340, partial [Microdochium bolleyi]
MSPSAFLLLTLCRTLTVALAATSPPAAAIATAPQQQCDHHPDQTFSQISPKAIVSDACASYSTLEKLNRKVKPAVDDLTKTTDFFAYYRL